MIRYGEGRAAPLTALSENLERLWLLAWCLAGALAGLAMGSLLRLVLLVVVGLALQAAGCQLVFEQGIWLPLVPAVLTVARFFICCPTT